MPRAAARARRQKKPTYPADPPSPAPSRPGLIPRPTTRPTPGLVPQACLRLATPGRPLAPPGPTRGRPRGPPQPWQPKRLSLLKLYWNETMIGPGQGGRRNLEPPNTPIPWEWRSSRGLRETEPTGYCWQSAAGHLPFPSRACTARTYTDSYGGCAAPQAGPKNVFTGQY